MLTEDTSTDIIRADQPFWKMETYKREVLYSTIQILFCVHFNKLYFSQWNCWILLYLKKKKRKHSDSMPLAARSFKYPLLPGYWWTVKIKTALTRSVPLNFSLERDFIVRREISLWIKETKSVNTLSFRSEPWACTQDVARLLKNISSKAL